MAYKVICCLGDSIANGYWDAKGLGWFGRLQEKVAAAFPLQFGFNNLAQSGDRSMDVLHRLSAEAMHREPDVLVIAVGVNDIIRWQKPNGPTDQSPQTSHENWQRILKTGKKITNEILVVGLIPNNEAAYPCTGYDGETPMWHFNEDIKAYNKNLSAWCAEHEIPFLNTFDDWMKNDHTKLLHDGGHPNAEGHELLSQQVFKKLEELQWLN